MQRQFSRDWPPFRVPCLPQQLSHGCTDVTEVAVLPQFLNSFRISMKPSKTALDGVVRESLHYCVTSDRLAGRSHDSAIDFRSSGTVHPAALCNFS